MKTKRLLALVMLAGITVSCSKQNKTPQTIEEIITSAREATPRVLPVNAMLADPYQIQTQDGYLLWIDNTKDKLLTVYDLQQEKIVRQAINEGKGPSEILPPVQLLTDPTEHTVGLLSRRTGQYTVYRLTDLTSDTLLRPVRSFQFAQGKDHCVKIGSDRYLSAFYFPDTVASAAVCDTAGKFLGWINTFPEEIREIAAPTDRYVKGQSSMAYLPEEQVLCVAYTSYLDRIQFFDMSDAEPTLIREYGVPGLQEKYTPSSLRAYATDRFIYVLWVNNLDKERYVLKFDARGEAVDCIHIRKTAYFCVSPDDEKIYTLEQNDSLEPVVAEYRLR